ncbi:hypothetical protein OIU84_008086 [Salix udensis]|uniref:Uncharacterized protein n=1 Tax=Salix udensis TaxID=889485 RepID=A0AAD6JU97_9ROSI|nr:hypothetical protein OIU84_008086 [Salix udensis]
MSHNLVSHPLTLATLQNQQFQVPPPLSKRLQRQRLSPRQQGTSAASQVRHPRHQGDTPGPFGNQQKVTSSPAPDALRESRLQNF